MAVILRRLATLIVYVAVLSLNPAGNVEAGVLVQVPSQGNLNDYLCGNLSLTVTNGMTLELNPDANHMITGHSCLWQNKESITVQSSGDEPATVQCDGSEYTQSGFGFVQMASFTLRNIRFENCGGIVQNASAFAPINTSPRRAIESNQHAVIFLSRCLDVTIENVVFSNYRGYALYAVNLVGGNHFQRMMVTNSFSYLSGNRSSTQNDLTYSGSGLFFHFSDDPPLLQTDTNIDIVNSTLLNNFNIYPHYLLNSLLETRLQNQREDFPLHGAGGLTVHFEQKNRKIVMNVERTHFINNGGSTGGGSLIVSRNTVERSNKFFTACTFVNNSIRYSSLFAGGGLQLAFIFSYSKLQNIINPAATAGASVVIENSEFRENTGENGAAMAIFTEAQNISTINIELKSVHFVDNEATIDGDCILVESENSATYSERRPNLKLESITVLHSGRKNDIDSTAALSFNNIFVTINGTAQNPTTISNGENGGLKLFNTYAFLTGQVHFTNNSATKGGAIAMEANSYLLFREPAHILFSNNQAVMGGAIYSDIVRGLQCVMQFVRLDTRNVALNLTQLEDLDFNITFVDNKADKDGHAIYAEPIFKCNWFSESIVQIPTDKVADVYSTLYHFKSNERWVNYQEQIRSHPYRPCFCHDQQNRSPVCTSDRLNDTSISVPPGRSFVIPIVPADITWNPVESIIEAQLPEGNDDNIRFNNNQSRHVNDLNGTSCFPQTFVLRNAENTTVTIKLSVQSVVGQFIKANVNLMQCPFGFRLNKSTGICDCIALFGRNNIQCDIEKSLFIKPETYWIGRTKFEDDVPACVVKCPFGYCDRSNSVNLKFDNQCIGNRTGEMCGQCKSGMSMQFGSTDCKTCNNYWLFTIVLYVFAGIFLVIMLFLLKLTISEGLFGTVLFYAQLFSINIGLLVSTNETKFTTVFISLLNLELGFPICFYNGMTQAGKHGLQFIFPVYLWIIVAVITILSRYSNKLANLVGSDCAKVFVTLIYFSYTKLQRTATSVFVYATIGTDTNKTYPVWFYDGGQSYFHGHHLVLGLISIVFLMFILTPYMLFTLLSQWCLHNSWISRHFKPLIDATLAPFKDRWRFWFGLRLLIINLLILIAILVTPISSDAVTYAHLVIIMFLLVFQAHIKPYKSKLIHYLDLFFLINYVLFLLGCLFIFSVLKPTKAEQGEYVTAVEVIIIGSAFAVFVVTIVCHIVFRVRKFYGEKRSGQIKLNQSENEVGTEMDNASTLTSYPSSSNDEYRPQNVTLTVVDIIRNREEEDGGRLRESLLGDY